MKLEKLPGGASLLNDIKGNVNMLVKRPMYVQVTVGVDMPLKEVCMEVADACGFDIRSINRAGRDGMRRMTCKSLVCFFASEYAGYDYKDIASVLNVSRSAVSLSVDKTRSWLSIDDPIAVEFFEKAKNRLLYGR